MSDSHENRQTAGDTGLFHEDVAGGGRASDDKANWTAEIRRRRVASGMRRKDFYAHPLITQGLDAFKAEKGIKTDQAALTLVVLKGLGLRLSPADADALPFDLPTLDDEGGNDRGQDHKRKAAG